MSPGSTYWCTPPRISPRFHRPEELTDAGSLVREIAARDHGAGAGDDVVHLVEVGMGDTGHDVSDLHLGALHHRDADVAVSDVQVSHHDVTDRRAGREVVQALQQNLVDLPLRDDRGTSVLGETGDARQQGRGPNRSSSNAA